MSFRSFFIAVFASFVVLTVAGTFLVSDSEKEKKGSAHVVTEPLPENPDRGQSQGQSSKVPQTGVSQGTTHLEYDALHRLTKVTYGNGVVIEYEYDANGNRLNRKVTNPNVPSSENPSEKKP